MEHTRTIGIPVERMPQQLLAQTSADDWTGLASAAERRKRQNRLNKRSQYQRARLQRQPQVRVSPPAPAASAPPISAELDQAHAAIWLVGLVFEDPDIKERVLTLARDAYLQHTMNTPRLTQLPFLITLNINIAMAGNATRLGLEPGILCREESISPFNLSGASTYVTATTPCPEKLKSTPVQRETVHHPWIDVFPFPVFRDNVIRAVEAGLMDEDELCGDIAEANFDGTPRPSLIIWGRPCDPSGWEASVLFLRKWGWLLKGCSELMEATNRWRETRGEARIYGYET